MCIHVHPAFVRRTPTAVPPCSDAVSPGRSACLCFPPGLTRAKLTWMRFFLPKCAPPPPPPEQMFTRCLKVKVHSCAVLRTEAGAHLCVRAYAHIRTASTVRSHAAEACTRARPENAGCTFARNMHRPEGLRSIQIASGASPVTEAEFKMFKQAMGEQGLTKSSTKDVSPE
jgi:hypothetical protein